MRSMRAERSRIGPGPALWALLFLSTPVVPRTEARAASKPNVILILTDDQGYGDISSHGNPVLQTPNLDALRAESVCFTDFHVAPMCTPTRGELMTGIDAFRNGATAVCEGRSMPRRELPMMPEYFRRSGYATAHFGKWHLGDNYPYRPQDRGFDESIHNKAWGIASLSEHWENDAFDDQYWHGNALERFEGYNTDVFFRQAMEWIEKQDRPFFVYLPTTAAHSPFIVPEKFTKPYSERAGKVPPEFFGMIANIDENIARLDSFLEERNLRENTILIFMTDNGTVAGHTVFNAGMRGHKTSQYDGGHRVPFFLRWPAGGYHGHREIDALTHGTDLLPTLIDLCGLKKDERKSDFDGRSLRPLLEGDLDALDDRMVVIQYRAEFKPWSGAVLWKKWRLVNGDELYDLGSDPGQRKNVHDQHTEVVRAMRDHYEKWMARTRPIMGQTNFVSVGTEHETTTWLSSCNWTGSYADNWGNLARQNTPGHWNLEVEAGGDYRVSMYMFHPEAKVPLNGSLRRVPARAVARARLLVDGEATTVPTAPGDTHASFRVPLEKGDRVELEGHFLDREGRVLSGAFYTFVQRIDPRSGTPSVIEYVSVAGAPRAAPAVSSRAGSAEIPPAGRPNILVILSDDQGWGDIGYNSPERVYTPNLDRLAAAGAILSRHYVMPQCTPTRLALFTGRYPGRFGISGLEASNLPIIPHGTVTMASFLKARGYRTYLTGKWHLGSWAAHGPKHHGFDHAYGALAGAVGAYDHRYRLKDHPNSITWHRDHEIIPGYENGTHVTDLVTREAIRVIRQKREGPFFLYLPYFAPHTPLDERGPFVDTPTQPDPEHPGRWLNEDGIEWFNDPAGIIQKEKDPEKRLFLAVLHHLDSAIGKVIAALDDSGQRENTVIFFSSDNGPQVNWPGDAYPSDLRLTDFNQSIPFRGAKTDVYEGGMRVPAFVNWPGKISPRRIESARHIIDWLPTIAAIIGIGVTIPEGQPALDGEDFSKSLLSDPEPEHDGEREIYSIHRSATDKWALRRGDWKIVRYGKGEPTEDSWKLYHLASDPEESMDVAPMHPQKVSELHRRFLAHRARDRKGRNFPGFKPPRPK